MTKEIYSITAANKELASSYGEVSEGMMMALNKSKAWNFVSRMTSGSGFWKIQNKVRAVTDAYVVMDEAMQRSIETQGKAMDTWEKLSKTHKKIPKRDLELGGKEGEYSTKAIQNTKEWKTQRGAYIQAMGGDVGKGETALRKVIEQQLDNQHKLMKKMAKDQIEQLKYDSYGWRLDKKMWFKTKKHMKLVGGIIKKAMMFLVQASIGMLLLILAIPLIIAFVKNFKGFLDGMGIKVGLEDIKKAFKFIKGIIVSFYEIFKKLREGDIMGALRQYLTEIIIPIGKLVVKGAIKLVEIVSALFSAFVKTLVESIIGVVKMVKDFVTGGGIKKAGGWLKSKIPGMWRGGRVLERGMALVGEKGPELVGLPQGARVLSNAASKAMGGNTIHVHVNGRVGASDVEIRDIARKVAREIGLQMNRTTSARAGF